MRVLGFMMTAMIAVQGLSSYLCTDMNQMVDYYTTEPVRSYWIADTTRNCPPYPTFYTAICNNITNVAVQYPVLLQRKKVGRRYLRQRVRHRLLPLLPGSYRSATLLPGVIQDQLCVQAKPMRKRKTFCRCYRRRRSTLRRIRRLQRIRRWRKVRTPKKKNDF